MSYALYVILFFEDFIALVEKLLIEFSRVFVKLFSVQKSLLVKINELSYLEGDRVMSCL